MKHILIDSNLYELLKSNNVNFETLTLNRLVSLLDDATIRTIAVRSNSITKQLKGVSVNDLLHYESDIVTEPESEVWSKYTTFISDEMLTIVHNAPLGNKCCKNLIDSIITAAAERYTFSEMMKIPSFKQAFKLRCER